MMSSGARRARIHAEQQKNKKKAKKQAKKEIPQPKKSWLQKLISRALGAKQDDNPELAFLGAAENNALKHLSFKYFDKVNFADLFKELCGPGRTSVTYRAFCMYFRFKPDKWVRRMFDLINSQVTGSFSFLELIQFCSRFLYIDRDTTEEFCFRFLSRRGLSFVAQYSILDLDDFVTFVALRYRKITRLPKQRKMALEIFSSIDDDGDGGVTFEEFQKYCRKNPVFLKLSHPLQNHLRKCIFGIEFWVDKSRAIKTTLGSAFERISKVGGRINRESEMYTLKHIEDPVIDKHGYALRTRQKPPKDDDDSDESDEESEKGDVDIDADDGNSKKTEENNEAKEGSDVVEVVDMEVSREQLSKIVAADKVDKAPINAVLLNPGSKFHKETRKQICYFNSFSIDEDIRQASFRIDFPDIVKERNIRRKKRHAEDEERKKKISALTHRTYSRLIAAVSDVVFKRVGLRVSFNKWLEVQQLTSKAIVYPPNYTGLRRTESKYRAKESAPNVKNVPIQSIQEADHSDEESLEEDDCVVENESLKFGNVYEQILRSDESRFNKIEQHRTESYMDDYLFEKFTKNCQSATSLDSLQLLSSQAQNNLQSFS